MLMLPASILDGWNQRYSKKQRFARGTELIFYLFFSKNNDDISELFCNHTSTNALTADAELKQSSHKVRPLQTAHVPPDPNLI